MNKMYKIHLQSRFYTFMREEKPICLRRARKTARLNTSAVPVPNTVPTASTAESSNPNVP